MIRLCLNGKEYLSSECNLHSEDKPFESGHVSGNYYGSSTRIAGGEIWHPQRGYLTLRISIQYKLPEDLDWRNIFDEDVNFCEESVRAEELQYAQWIDFEKSNDMVDEIEANIQSLIDNKNLVIERIRAGTICNFQSGSKITLRNDTYEVILNFRDLHRFECEVQISGCSYKLI